MTLHIQPLKMEQIDGSETSAFKNQTPGYDTSYPAFEDGTDRWFRNVGIQKSAAGNMTLHIQPLKMEQIDGSETSTCKNQTPGIHSKEYSQHYLIKVVYKYTGCFIKYSLIM
jgi:hypothetical protein